MCVLMWLHSEKYHRFCSHIAVSTTIGVEPIVMYIYLLVPGVLLNFEYPIITKFLVTTQTELTKNFITFIKRSGPKSLICAQIYSLATYRMMRMCSSGNCQRQS